MNADRGLMIVLLESVAMKLKSVAAAGIITNDSKTLQDLFV